MRGYASDGNKSITVLNNAYAGTIYGAYNLNTGHNSGLKVQGAESYYSNGKYFAPKATKDKVISITLDGGSAVQVYGGMSQLTTPLPAEMKAAYKALGSKEAAEAYALNNPAWALNEKVEINIINGKVGVTADGNGHSTLISNPTANAITGAGMAGASINNTVSINVDGEDSVVYGSIYAGASEFTNTSYDATTYGRIRGYVENTKVTINNGTINGSVHGGGMEGGLVKENTRVTLAGGQINGDVYGAGSGDEVAGNTQVVIKGEGATVTGTIYGGGSNNAVVNGDRILTFDSYTATPDADGYATVDWNKYQDFNSLELQNSKVNLGQVGTEYESLKLCGSQAIADSVRNGKAVKLDMTSYLPGGTTATIGSSLTVNSNIQLAEGSRIWGSESVSIDLGGFVLNADGSTSTLTANSITGTDVYARYGNLTATEGNINLQKSEIENSDLIAEKGTVALTNSTMNGGAIVAGEALLLKNSAATVDSVNNGESVRLDLHGTPGIGGSALVVNADLKVADDSQVLGLDANNQYGLTPYESSVTAKSITFEGGKEGSNVYASVLKATEGNISLGSNTTVDLSNLIAENGTVALTNSTMKGGDIVAGEALLLKNSAATVDSVNNGESVRLDLHGTPGIGGSALVVNADLKVADDSQVLGLDANNQYGFTPYESSVTAKSITFEGGKEGSNVYASVLKATEGNIALGSNTTVDLSNLIAENGTVTLTNSTMKGGDIVAKSFFNDGSNTVVDNVTVSSALLASPEPGKKAGLVNTGSLTINGNLTVGNNSRISQEGDGTSLVIKGDVKNSISVLYNLGGKVEFGGNVTLNHSYLNGSIEFSGGEGTEAKLTGGYHYMLDPIGGAPVDCTITHSGAGNVAYGDITIDGKLTVNQSGSGEFSVENFAGSMLGIGSNLHINQSGTGKIVVGGMLINDSTTLVQTGGGTVAVLGYGVLDSLTVEGNSTFHIEKGASVTVETLALSDATLSFTEGADALTISASGAITALDGVMFELILGESAAPLFEGGPDTTVDFSFTVLDGLANLTAGEDLVTAMQQAFTVDQLQLLGANANGALFDLIIQDATMEYTNGAVTISGKASIPEPTTATLSLLALAALASRRRRQK